MLLPCGVPPMGYSSSRTSLMWVLSMGYSPSGVDCSSTSQLWGHVSRQKTCFCMGICSWATAPTRSLLCCGLSEGCSCFETTCTCSGMGFLLLASAIGLHVLYKVIDHSMFSAFVSCIGFGFCFFSLLFLSQCALYFFCFLL